MVTTMMETPMTPVEKIYIQVNTTKITALKSCATQIPSLQQHPIFPKVISELPRHDPETHVTLDIHYKITLDATAISLDSLSHLHFYFPSRNNTPSMNTCPHLPLQITLTCLEKSAL